MTEDQDMDGEGEDHNGGYEEDDELFDDEDADEEAEAVAKQLGDALWADISKAYAQQGASQPVQRLPTLDAQTRLPSPRRPSPSLSEESDDEQTLVNAVQTVLELAAGHAFLNEVLSDTIVPGTQDETLLQVLTEAVGTKVVSPELADTLGTLVQTIADGELFNDLENAIMNREADENEHGGPRQLSWPAG